MKDLTYTAEQLGAFSADFVFEHAYEGTPFVLKGMKSPDDKPGHWSTSVLFVYRAGVLLGGYRRMYASHAKETFAPFEWKGQWYTLYSANYTCTRVLRLNEHSLEDWCGEAPAAQGFCPAEFFAPQVYRIAEDGVLDPAEAIWCFSDSASCDSYEEFRREAEELGCTAEYPGFAFLSGCIWGDDGAWKLRYVDYSRIDEKLLAIDERFGYHPLPGNLTLRQCVDLSCWEPRFPFINAAKQERFCIR